jgi:hypothetical protein
MNDEVTRTLHRQLIPARHNSVLASSFVMKATRTFNLAIDGWLKDLSLWGNPIHDRGLQSFRIVRASSVDAFLNLRKVFESQYKDLDRRSKLTKVAMICISSSDEFISLSSRPRQILSDSIKTKCSRIALSHDKNVRGLEVEVNYKVVSNGGGSASPR